MSIASKSGATMPLWITRAEAFLLLISCLSEKLKRANATKPKVATNEGALI
jgi:hypothetical protein